MKCKAGDLAVVVRSKAGNEGKLVTCIRLATPEDFALGERLPVDWPSFWLLDRELNSVLVATFEDGAIKTYRGRTRVFPDALLRPIRDPGDGAVDETLLRLGIPEGETV